MGKKYKNNDHRIKFKDDVLYIHCRICEKWKEETNFAKANNNTYGRNFICSPCVKEDNVFGLKQSDDRFANPAREILIEMGFDIDKPIHPQFCDRIKEKHGVKL